MQITGSGTPPPLNLRLLPQVAATPPLRQGDTVSALVVQSNTPGRLTLDIGGKLLQTLSSLQLRAGTTLQLRVEKQNGQILLQLSDKQLQQLSQQQAMRQTLPRQQSLKQVIEQVLQLQGSDKPPVHAGQQGVATGRGEMNSAPASPPRTVSGLSETDTRASGVSASARTDRGASALPVAKAVARLIAALPTLARLGSGEALHQAIALSGMFTESTLLQGSLPVSADSDVKTALLRLARSIRQSLAEGGREGAPGKSSPADTAATSREQLQGLLRQVESGVARIQMNQLNSLANQGQGNERIDLRLELPLLHPQSGEIELLQLQIRREAARRGGDNEPCWSVTLHLNPSDYGAVHAVVTLSGGKISTTFWCEEAHTGELFRNELEQLQQRLDKQGLEVGRCSALVGKPPEPDNPPATVGDNGLIDTRA